MQSVVFARCLLPLLIIISLNAWSTAGRILSFEGDARVNGEPATAETLLHREDTVSTASGATIKIILSDNSVLDLDEDSEILISDYIFDPSDPQANTSKVDILAGTLRYVSGRIAKDDPQKISFTADSSTIDARGTFINISVCTPDGCE